MRIDPSYQARVADWSQASRALLRSASVAVPLEPEAEPGDIGPHVLELFGGGDASGGDDERTQLDVDVDAWLATSTAMAESIESGASTDAWVDDGAALGFHRALLDGVMDIAGRVEAASGPVVTARAAWLLADDASADPEALEREIDLVVSRHVAALLRPRITGGAAPSLTKVTTVIDDLEGAAGKEVVALATEGLATVTVGRLSEGLGQLFGDQVGGWFKDAARHVKGWTKAFKRSGLKVMAWVVGRVNTLVKGAGDWLRERIESTIERVGKDLGPYVGDAMGLLLGRSQVLAGWSTADAAGRLPADAEARTTAVSRETMADFGRVTRIRGMADSTVGKLVLGAATVTAGQAFYLAYALAVVAGIAYCTFELWQGLRALDAISLRNAPDGS